MANGVAPATPLEHHRFHFLDALRGLAAILVVARHAPASYAGRFATSNSYLAVDFFFCLSGFVIAFSYEQRLSSSLRLKDFWAARIIRLYPIAALGTMLGTVQRIVRMPHGLSFLHNAGTLLPQVILSLLVFPVLTGGNLFPLDGVLWTLFCELVANLLYAAMVRAKVASTKIVGTIVCLSAVAAGLERYRLRTLDLGYSLDQIHIGLTRVLLSFFLGVLVLRLYRHKAPARWAAGSAAVSGGLITVAFLALLCGLSFLTENLAAELVTLLLILPGLVYLGARVSLAKRWTAACAFLGAISYPLYVLHVPLLWPMTTARGLAFPLAHQSLAAPVMLLYTAVMVLLSWLAVRLYDERTRKYLTTMYKQRTGALATRHLRG